VDLKDTILSLSFDPNNVCVCVCVCVCVVHFCSRSQSVAHERKPGRISRVILRLCWKFAWLAGNEVEQMKCTGTVNSSHPFDYVLESCAVVKINDCNMIIVLSVIV
jgi:hypothetical protein